jgi:hypothetical protein
MGGHPQNGPESGRQDRDRELDDGGSAWDLRDPGAVDFKRAKKLLAKIVRENQEWLKEMANK